MKLDKLRIVVKKLNILLDRPDTAVDFNEQLDQLLAEFDDVRRPKSNVFIRTSHKSPSTCGTGR